ncbi:hypothetical protein DFS34DRAFT_649507 [Phlyctochytrium arcticum]|nr:hypothetical protein DFS34DRAFT_649507 [Phlyctochytrium arcticum]
MVKILFQHTLQYRPPQPIRLWRCVQINVSIIAPRPLCTLGDWDGPHRTRSSRQICGPVEHENTGLYVVNRFCFADLIPNTWLPVDTLDGELAVALRSSLSGDIPQWYRIKARKSRKDIYKAMSYNVHYAGITAALQASVFDPMQHGEQLRRLWQSELP